MERSIPDTALRNELLRLAREPGCVVCHAEGAAVDRFFAWYRIEQYRESSIVQHMQEARGFCPEHTRQFVASAPPHLISTVYQDLLASAVTRLRSATHDSSALPEAQAERIRPQVACLACEQRRSAANWIARGMPVGLLDSQVRDVVMHPSALCLPHFLHLLPSLAWEAAQLLAHAQLSSLQVAWSEYDTGAEPTGLVRLLVGVHSDEALQASSERLSMSGPADSQAAFAMKIQDAQPEEGSGNESKKTSSWSPALAQMERLFTLPGCPLCREEEMTASKYLRWLLTELSEKASSLAGDDARWLCRNHLWRFIWTGNDKAVRGLLRSICMYWMDMLQTLIAGLDRPPSTSFAVRCWHGIVDARQRTLPVTRWHAFWEGIAEGRRSVAQRLSELRDPVVQTHQCPVCRFQHERAVRLANLLDHSLTDTGIARRYEDTSGVCFRHLPVAIEHCTEPSTVRLLLRTQYTRVAVVHWELEEYRRKHDWTHRWEPRDEEQTAWCRAAAQFTGIDVPKCHPSISED